MTTFTPIPAPVADFTPPEKGRLTRIADDLLWARFDLPFRLNHINIYILENDDGWTVIDCGVNNADTAEHWQALLSGTLSGKPVRKIIVTHHHPDHIGYAGALAEITDAPIAMTEPEYAYACRLLASGGAEFRKVLVEAYRRYGLDEDILERAGRDNDRYIKHLSKIPEPRIIRAGDVVQSRAGAWRVRSDCGHSIDQIGLMDTQRNIYIAGDFLLPRISPNVSTDMLHPAEDRLGAYMGYLGEMAKSLPDDMLILPGHDWPFTEGAGRARELIRHHEARMAALLDAAAAKPISVAGAMAVLFTRSFDMHEIFFAAGEAHSHLARLVATGKMTREIRDGVMIFSALT